MGYIKTKTSEKGQPIELFYQDLGEGKPVVLIHGWPLSQEMWEYQVNALVENGLRVITYDRRGFGKSSKPLNGYDYDTFTDDLKAVLETLNLEDVTLVGFSMGGGEVVRYFSRYGGSRITQAVLLGAVTPFLLKTKDNPDGAHKEIFTNAINVIKEDRIGFIDMFGQQFFGITKDHRPLSDPLLEYYRTLASFAGPIPTQKAVIAYSETDFRKDLNAVHVPTLIIHGDADTIVPIEISSDRTAQMIPDNYYKIYPGAPHGFFYTHKEKLNEDLLEFILHHDHFEPVTVKSGRR
ncbi:MAG: alpha/beta hydrolase [Sporocytophaga sp.]|uniref:alpha/beta fold hydrolase n=1 Tax=Sporocytophaga sp. TaxID=2231183 RepID=UPI001B2E1ED2|nr:alpha/beta hydrolase [Sporocytophaga sp.]MBO9702525.1 alpha/beta hydrolase [Sporocytophaga sp.]